MIVVGSIICRTGAQGAFPGGRGKVLVGGMTHGKITGIPSLRCSGLHMRVVCIACADINTPRADKTPAHTGQRENNRGGEEDEAAKRFRHGKRENMGFCPFDKPGDAPPGIERNVLATPAACWWWARGRECEPTSSHLACCRQLRTSRRMRDLGRVARRSS